MKWYHGFVTFSDSIVIHAEWNNDKPNEDKIRINFPKGVTFSGKLHEGIAVGPGTMTGRSGDIFTGKWVQGLRDG